MMQPSPWKVLLASTTNVAVDRVLMVRMTLLCVCDLLIRALCCMQVLLSLGFEDFVRVGSVKKIAKQILPFSTSAAAADKQV